MSGAERNLVVELFEAACATKSAWDMAEVPVGLLYRAAVEIAELRQALRTSGVPVPPEASRRRQEASLHRYGAK